MSQVQRRKTAAAAAAAAAAAEQADPIDNRTAVDKLLASQGKTHRPASSYTVKVADPKRFGPLLAPPKPMPKTRKAGPFTSKDYQSGYISDEGEQLRSTIQQVAESTQPEPETEEQSSAKRGAKRSRSGKKIERGTEQEAIYYGEKVGFRVDFTRSKSGEFVPHARMLVGSKDISTMTAAQVAMDMASSNTTQATDFVLGFNPSFSEGRVPTPPRRGRKTPRKEPPPEPTRSAAQSTGLQMRALVRGSNVFSSNDAPVLDGYQMSRVNTAQDVSLLFHDPAYNTGRLGSQNSSPAATSEFAAFEEIVETRKSSASHTTRPGTNLDQVAFIRKASAINASFPDGEPLLDITKLRKPS